MNIHEYQAKELLKEYGCAVQTGHIITHATQAHERTQALKGSQWVVKAQIHAGGRGKGRFSEINAGEGGGVRIVDCAEAAANEAKKMLGHTLVTQQTGDKGKTVNRVYIEESTNIIRELYLSLLIERASAKVTFICSTEGGIDIEKVAQDTPEKIFTLPIEPTIGYQAFHGRKLAAILGLKGSLIRECVQLAGNLYRLFMEKDCEMLEINPLIVNDKNELVCIDAKIGFDSNALYRHSDIVALRDESEEDPKEITASQFNLNYIALDGEIGCMVNGAGLAMATMDIIKLYGSAPANFLDVGGSANQEQVTQAFKIITSDPNVKGILVNIFGGIMRCDIIAQGVVAAVRDVGLSVPLVVRLEGTNVEKGAEIINDSGLNITPANTLGDAAQKIIKAIKNSK